jgi:tritrans,polycis-undecaprenyl-diphosphate synthase [geranylgeranyl-diphosphate specific]
MAFERLPNHIAIVTDGNRRYARESNINIKLGHEKGAEKVLEVVRWCEQIGIKEITIYSFSTENFERSDAEIENIFNIIEKKLRELNKCRKGYLRRTSINVIGDRSRLPSNVIKSINYAENNSPRDGDFQVNVAIAYGGRNQLLNATKEILMEVQCGALDAAEINQNTIRNRLYDPPISDVDLIIRTGGEKRTSNFYPWLAWGAESYFEVRGVQWPAFTRRALFHSLYRWNRARRLNNA